ncbi:MAG: DUF2892 domain-containing protein [Dongiaceae bacterium]
MADGIQKAEQAADAADTNVGNVERVVSSLIGVRMLLDGLYRPSLLRMIMGSALLCRGVTGHSALYRMLGLDTRQGLDAAHGPAPTTPTAPSFAAAAPPPSYPAG